MVVITQVKTPLPAGVRRAASLAQAIADYAHENELFIIGGARVYASALPIAHRILMTEVELTPPADVFFPKPDPTDWQERSRVRSTSVNGIRFSIITYERRQTPVPASGS